MISEFYVDKYGGDTVGREGGGGSILCCAMLPVKWRPGLTVEIRWGVEDWTHANDAEIAKGNYESVSDARLYIAKVPVEKYDEPYDLIVHFFPRGRVRVVGDKTTHGGTVIAAQPALKALGKAVAVDGDLTMCPQCKGNFPIQVASSDRHHHGKALAYDGDKAACGAKLISSI
ncbi:DUF3304 domain-containing protein [Duganella sp. FT50W]|uniref:DUF3304 domain-containing protein n=2 Tax=Duganella lactea TaxID=2692173 RepID=A0A6L8MJ73_9BURK|nr:DUF3304 domain-containing protein [Duganella lactea]